MKLNRRREGRRNRPVPENVHITYRQMLRYLRPYAGRMALAMFCLFLGSLLGLVFPLVIQRVLDTVINLESLRQLDQLTLVLVGVFAVRSFLSFVEGFNLAYIGERIVFDLRKEVFAWLTFLPLGFYADQRVGELNSRLSSDTQKLRAILTGDIGTIISNIISLVGSLAIMVALNWRLMGFLLLLIPVTVVVGNFFRVWLRRISAERQDVIAEMSAIAEETLTSIRVVKAFVREDYENSRYENRMLAALNIAVRVFVVRKLFSSLMAFIGLGSLAAFLWFGGREVLAGRLSGGELAAFMIYGLNVSGSISSFVGLYANVQEAVGATKRIFEILQTQPTVADAPDAQPLPAIQGHIRFEDVHFAYDPRKPVLQGVTLSIPAGESLALVGPSGAGKSTAFNLIPRFYDPTAGRVCIDGIDLRGVTQASLREQIAIVPQETQLFSGTIRENILYGRLDASEEELIAAAKAANAHDFIIGLPDGYASLVGERGVKLSGGQRQRIAIARAILKNPRILLLDEATSSLDSESEALVQDALNRLMQGRTTIIIAHRLSTIKRVDRIAVLQEGEVIALGRHEDLLAEGGLYARLYQMQFHEMEEAVSFQLSEMS